MEKKKNESKNRDRVKEPLTREQIQDMKHMTPEKKYKLTKFFGFGYIRDYKKSERLELINRLKLQEIQYLEFTKKLNPEEKIELSIDWIENLKKLKKYQTNDFHIRSINAVIENVQQETLENSTKDKSIEPIKWNGSITELTALIKSLKQSNVLDTSLTEKVIVSRFEQFFDIELKNYEKTKSDIRKRTKDSTPFIDKLRLNLENWIKNKD